MNGAEQCKCMNGVETHGIEKTTERRAHLERKIKQRIKKKKKKNGGHGPGQTPALL